MFIVEGDKMVEELFLSDFSIKQVYINKSTYRESKKNYSPGRRSLEWIEIGAEEMQKISGHPTPPPILALVDFPQYSLDELQWPVLALDNVQDPGNMGTLIRIADWFNFKTLVCSKGSVHWHNPKVIQSSMGSFLRIPVLELDLLEFLSRSGKIIYGASLKGSSLYQENLENMELLVLGNESKGISPQIESIIDRFIHIPGRGNAESLNVAIAGGIICSERSRQLESKGSF
jgi:TrmH family RNA methyltransferase